MYTVLVIILIIILMLIVLVTPHSKPNKKRGKPKQFKQSKFYYGRLNKNGKLKRKK